MTNFERNHTAKAIKNIRKILQQGKSEPIPCSCSNCEVELDRDPVSSRFTNNMFWLAVLTAVLMLIGPCTPAHAYTIEGYSLNTWVESIHKAEGNDNYGILSLPCSTKSECRHICAVTVLHNYKRWLRTDRSFPFLSFLQRRYCPIEASNDPTGLNAFWASNVNYFLQRGI